MTTATRPLQYLAGIMLLTLGVALMACGSEDPTPTPAPTPTPPPAPEADSGDSAFEREWQALIEAAQAEGNLVVIASRGEEHDAVSVLEAFADKFNIDTIISGGRQQANVDRVLAEQSAGRYDVDISFNDVLRSRQLIDGDALESMPPLFVHPEVLDQSLWYANKWLFADAQEQYVFTFAGRVIRVNVLSVCYNLDQVDEADFADITSDLDWLAPNLIDKYKGKVVVYPPPPYSAGGGGGYYTIYAHPDLGPELLRGVMVDYEPEYQGNDRLIADGIGSGKYAMAFLGSRSCGTIEELAEQGLPVAVFEREMPSQEPFLQGGSSSQQLAVIKNQPNPNAAKLFLNWFLGREGQTMVQELWLNSSGVARPSLRLDIPPGKVDPNQKVQPGVVYGLCIECDPSEEARQEEAYDYARRLYEEQVGITP